jgi:hypothetical protein
MLEMYVEAVEVIAEGHARYLGSEEREPALGDSAVAVFGGRSGTGAGRSWERPIEDVASCQ